MNSSNLCVLCGHAMDEHRAVSIWHMNRYEIQCKHEVGQREEPCDCNAGFKDVNVTVNIESVE